MKCPQWIKDTPCWIVGVNPQGLGTLLVGIAALIALCQTSSLLDRVLEVQEQAKKIYGVVSLLNEQLRRIEATQAVASVPALSEPNPTREQIIEAIKNIPNQSVGRPLIYLPSDKRNETIEKIFNAKNVQERTMILKNSLKVDDIRKNIDEIRDWDKGE